MTDLTYVLVTSKAYAEQLCARIDELKKKNAELEHEKTILQAKLTLATAAPLRDLPPLPSRSETTTPDELDTLAANVERLREGIPGKVI